MVLFKMKVLIFISLLSSYMNAEPPDNVSVYHKRIIKLIFSCFADRLNTIITTSNFKESIDQIAKDSEKLVATILIDNKFEQTNFQPILLQMPTYILPADSTTSFQAMLRIMKSSPWWNINTLFIIIGTSQGKCEPAAEFLELSWRVNLLSSIFLCLREDEGLMLYTYNPYTDRAPNPWNKVEKIEKVDDRWTLYVQKYFEGQEHCDSLNFDKTKFMDGYEIKGVTSLKRKTERNKAYDVNNLLDKHTSYAEAIYLKTIFVAANMTIIVHYDDSAHFYNGTASGFLVKIINKSFDMSLSSRRILPGLSATYPIMRGEGRILSHQRKFLRPEEKILAFYKPEIRYLTAIVLLISFIFILVVYKKLKFALAAFDVLRLLLSVGILLPLNRVSTRIFFLGIFYLIIILNATFQGNISAFLTKPERYYVDNIDDLQMYDDHVYTALGNKDLFEQIGVQNSVTYSGDIDCTEVVVNDTSAACVELTPRMLRAAAKYNLHISQMKVYEHYLSHWCRDDWPLLKKLDVYSARFLEAGLYEYWNELKMTIPMKRLKSNEMKETEAQYRPVTLDDLTFAFQIFGMGIGLSSLVFIIEIFPWQKSLRGVEKMRERCGNYFISKLKWRK